MRTYVKDLPLLHERRTGPYQNPGASSAFIQDKLMSPKRNEHRDETQGNSLRPERAPFLK